MKIEVDCGNNTEPGKSFFISVGLNKKEAISFDYTYKGHRVIKQILIKKVKVKPKNKRTRLTIHRGKPNVYTNEWVKS